MGRVLIVGAGIGGLTLALSLERRGFNCMIVEKAGSLSPVGAGIALGLNAMSVLSPLGVADNLVRAGNPLDFFHLTDAHGRVLQRISALPAKGRAPSIAIHRGDLHAILRGALTSTQLRLGITPQSVEEASDGVNITFSDGKQETYDLVIGADGIHSWARALLFPWAHAAYAGYACWRMVVSCSLARRNIATEMQAKGRRFGVVSLGHDRVYAYATSNEPRCAPDPAEGRVERFRRRFSDFEGDVPELLRRVCSPDQLIHNDIEEIVLPAWHKGRFVLLGDAAHALTPNMGQGAAMAIEDACVLAEELERAPGAFERAFQAYERRRQPRVRWIQDRSRLFGRLGQLDNALACAARDLAMRLSPASFIASQYRRAFDVRP